MASAKDLLKQLKELKKTPQPAIEQIIPPFKQLEASTPLVEQAELQRINQELAQAKEQQIILDRQLAEITQQKKELADERLGLAEELFETHKTYAALIESIKMGVTRQKGEYQHIINELNRVTSELQEIIENNEAKYQQTTNENDTETKRLRDELKVLQPFKARTQTLESRLQNSEQQITTKQEEIDKATERIGLITQERDAYVQQITEYQERAEATTAELARIEQQLLEITSQRDDLSDQNLELIQESIKQEDKNKMNKYSRIKVYAGIAVTTVVLGLGLDLYFNRLNNHQPQTNQSPVITQPIDTTPEPYEQPTQTTTQPAEITTPQTPATNESSQLESVLDRMDKIMDKLETNE